MMKKLSLSVIVLIFLLAGCKSKLMINGHSGYQIVIPDQADTLEVFAAEQLRHYLSEMSKTEIPVINENSFTGDNAIYIGKTNFAKSLAVDFGQLEGDGYAFKWSGYDLAIAGGYGKGTLYGVYDFLELAGFRKYTSTCTVIPGGNSISIPGNDTVVIPKVKYRTTSYRDTRDPGYMNWHKLSSQRETWGSFVHTFFNLMPPEKYFKDHPEYYALRDGQRLPTQLCLSNPAVADTLIRNLRKQMDKRPHLKYWSVSQADNNMSCQCPGCIELNRKYGGDRNRNSGAMIYFVNKVAKAFPDKMISTLAYWYTREAPDNIRPEPNVNIMLCNIESERHLPVPETDPAFANDLRNWGRLAEDIIIWDYNIQFSNLVSPFPNLHTISPNLQFFTGNNVNAFFMQANGNYWGEMAELRAYLISKLLWNPEADADAIIDDFVNGYYGNAGPYIRQYIDTMRYALIESGHHLGIFGSPEEARETYLSFEMMQEYERLFDEAEKEVKNDPELLRRVRIARQPIIYARLQIGRTEVDTPRSFFKHDSNGKVIADNSFITLLGQFVERCKDQGVNLLRERSIPPDQYMESHLRILNILSEADSSLSYKKKIMPITSPSPKYRDLQALTDGIFGSYEVWRDPRFDNWVGYEESHIDFILDLGEIMPVRSVSMDFFDTKDTWYQMFLPEYVIYEFSSDGKNYDRIFKVMNPVDPNEPEKDVMPREIYIQTFSADTKGCNARYIKVHAESVLRCPAWHVRTGDPVTMYSDEIVVK